MAAAFFLFICASLAIAAIVLASLAYTSPQLPQAVVNPGFISISQDDGGGLEGDLNITHTGELTQLKFVSIVVKGNNFEEGGSVIEYTGSKAHEVTWTVTGTLYQINPLSAVDNIITIDLVKNFNQHSTLSSNGSVGYTSAETGPNTRKTFAFSKTILMAPTDSVALYGTGTASQNAINNITIIGNVLPDEV